MNIPVTNQKLLLNGIILENHLSTLKELGIQNDDVVLVINSPISNESIDSENVRNKINNDRNMRARLINDHPGLEQVLGDSLAFNRFFEEMKRQNESARLQKESEDKLVSFYLF